MLINPTNGNLYFTTFYSLAFLLSFLVLLWEGNRRKIPLVPWVLLLIFAIVSFIAGTKIFAYTGKEWLQMFNHGSLIPTSEKILLGGMILGVIAIMTGKLVLKIRQPLLDAFAYVFPLGIAIQKFGCFMNGCCFGNPATIPWGVQYGLNSAPHNHHLDSALIGPNDLFSLPVHPVQLYEMAAAFLVVFIVFRTRKLWKVNGSLFLFSLLCYSIARFITEFFIDSSNYPEGWGWQGLFNQVQWVMALSSLALVLILSYREKKIGEVLQYSNRFSSYGSKSYLLFFIAEALMIYTLRNWFSPSEIISVFLTFLFQARLFLCGS